MEGIENQFILSDQNNAIIKVVGVGGGGSNAVSHMYKQNIKDVSFVICNTDDQALRRSSVPTKIQLGVETTHGLGAGNKPEVAAKAALESEKEIEEMLNDGTKMVFITAGMGGGTGTGAAPVVASIAKKMNILTIGIVTIPFAFEGKKKIIQALSGVVEMSESVDALLVINNDKLRTIYPDLELSNAFGLADDVLTNAARGIAEIITIEGHINVDFADVSTVMRNGGVAVMNSGYGEGENRVTAAIEDALNSPLLNNNDIHKSKKILLNFYCSKSNPMKMNEVDEIDTFMSKMGDDIEVIWGITFDEELGDKVKVTLLATGSDMNIVPEELMAEVRSHKPDPDPVSVDPNGNLDPGTHKTVPDPDLDPQPVQSQPRPWSKKESPMLTWAGKLYPKMNVAAPKVTISVDQFDDDDELKLMESQPAILRKYPNNKQ